MLVVFIVNECVFVCVDVQASSVESLISFVRQHVGESFEIFDDGSKNNDNDIDNDYDDDDSDDEKNNNLKPITFIIENKFTSKLSQLLLALDQSKSLLHIESYSLYQTSLEEIFLKLASERIVE
jgi:hypothetical protein